MHPEITYALVNQLSVMAKRALVLMAKDLVETAFHQLESASRNHRNLPR